MSDPYLILLPGMLCDARLFSHQTKHLSEVATVEVGDITRDDSVARMARSVLSSAPERFALAGLSLGGIVAFEILRQAPERVERLALLDTNACPPRQDQLESWRKFEAMTDEGRFMQVTTEHLMPTLLHPDRLEDTALTAAVEEMAENVGEEAFKRQLAAQASRPDSRESLSGISCPVLVAGGRQDALCPPELHEEIASGIPDTNLVFVEDCGHLSSLERPQAVTALLSYWIQDGRGI